MCLGLSTVEGISFSTTHYVQAQGGGSFCIYYRSFLYEELGTDKGGQWGAMTSLLCEQVIT